MQGAKIDGFEGVKLLEIKINRKLRQAGMSPIRLNEECADDLEMRRDDQYTLFKEIVKLQAPQLLQSASYKSQSAQAAYSSTMQSVLAMYRSSGASTQGGHNATASPQEPSLQRGGSQTPLQHAPASAAA